VLAAGSSQPSPAADRFRHPLRQPHRRAASACYHDAVPAAPFPLATLPGPSRRIRVEPLTIPEPAVGPNEPPDAPELPPVEPQPEREPVPAP
jgi:hypothetical protein